MVSSGRFTPAMLRPENGGGYRFAGAASRGDDCPERNRTTAVSRVELRLCQGYSVPYGDHPYNLPSLTERIVLSLPKIVSLFSGAGGLDLGFSQERFPLELAVDISPSAINTHRRNFPQSKAIVADLVELGPQGLLDALEGRLDDGDEIGIIGGPPCQGFSRANVSASPDDPRNLLPMTYLDLVEALRSRYKVRFVLFENVLGIRDKKHADSFAGILSRFAQMGFSSSVEVYRAEEFGVPQRRRRVIISAFDDPEALAAFNPNKSPDVARTVRDAIHELPDPAFFSRSLQPTDIPHHPNHWTMAPRSSKFGARDGSAAVSTGRSFRRLLWDQPSPTVAYGHREIHVHPDGARRLSIFEAMLLQGFPDTFVLEGTLSAQVEQVSNAVPPPLARELARAAAHALERSADAIERT